MLRLRSCTEDDIGGSGWFVDLVREPHCVMVASGKTKKEAKRKAIKCLRKLLAEFEERS